MIYLAHLPTAPSMVITKYAANDKTHSARPAVLKGVWDLGANVRSPDLCCGGGMEIFQVLLDGFRAVSRGLVDSRRGEMGSNCQILFGINKIPVKNHIRPMLDRGSPALSQKTGCGEFLEGKVCIR
jgi:hypothetical protein